MRPGTIFIMICCALFSSLKSQIPPFDWALKLDGPENPAVQVIDLEVDTKGNIVALGSYVDTVDFDPGPGILKSYSAVDNPFVIKLTPSGQLMWVKEFEVTIGNTMRGYQLALDTADNIVVAGKFQNLIDFDPSSATYTLLNNTNSTFVLKLNEGGQFQWAKEIAGLTNQMDLQIDLENSIYLAGSFKNSIDFDPGPSAVVKSSTNFNGFLLKLLKNGNFSWVKTLDGPANGYITSVVTSSLNEIYYSGFVGPSTDLNPDLGVQTNIASCTFISKLASSGLHIKTNPFVGLGKILSIAFQEGLIISGTYDGPFDLDPGIANQLVNTNFGMSEGFLIKLDTSLTYQWSKNIVSTVASRMPMMKVSCPTTSSIFIFSSFSGTYDFDPSGASYTLISHPVNSSNSFLDDYCVLSMDSAGNFKWAFNLGPCLINSMPSFCTKNYKLYLGGTIINSVDFDPSINTYTLAPTPGTFPSTHRCGFIMRLADCSSHNSSPLSIYVSQSNPCVGETVNLAATGADSYYWGTQYGTNSIITVTVNGQTNLQVEVYYEDECYKMKSIQIIPNTCVGLNEYVDNKFVVFPNPTNSNITIICEPGTSLEIEDCVGKIALSERLIGRLSEILVEGLPCGVYLLKLKSHDKKLIGKQKLVKNCN